MKNKKKRGNILTYVREFFSGGYTPAYINIAFLVFSILLVVGVLYAFIANSFLTVISEPVLGESDKFSIKALNDKRQVYEDETFGFEISYPANWYLEIRSSSLFIFTPWEKNYTEEEVSGYYLSLSVSSEDASPKKENDHVLYYYEVRNGSLFEFEYVPVNKNKLTINEIENYENIYSEMLDSFSF